MKSKSKNISNIDKISNNMEKIKSTNNWEDKIDLIKNTRNAINSEKQKLLNLKEKINSDIEDEDIEFGDMDINKVINKIKKNDNIEKQIENIQFLKLWIKQQKNGVILE